MIAAGLRRPPQRRWSDTCCSAVACRRRSPFAHRRTTWPRFRPAWARAFPRWWCCSAPPATWRGASCCPGCSTWPAPASSRAAASSACRSTTSTPTASAAAARAALDEFSTRKVSDADWEAFAPALDYVPLAAGAAALQGRGRARRAGARRREPAPALPERAAQRGAVGGAAARRGRAGRALAHRHGEAVRHRPGQRGARSTPSCTRSSPRSRSSASTTSSARSRRRTSSPSASPTACSSRSGTATSSTTCRSTCPRRWAWAQRSGLLRADRRVPRHGGHAPVPDPRLHGDGAADRARAGADQRGEEQGLPQHAADPAGERGARPVHRLPRRGGRRSRSPTPRPSSR